MDWSVIQNPYVIGGGLILAVVIIATRGASQGDAGPSYIDLASVQTRENELAYQFAATDGQRQIEMLKVQAAREQVQFDASLRSKAIDAEVWSRTFTAAQGAQSAATLARIEAQNRSDLAHTAADVRVTELQTAADTARYVAKKNAQASIWSGALSTVTQLAKTAAVVAA